MSKIQIYYDGLCHLCSREIDHYRKVKGSENLEFVDITADGFNAQDHGLDPKAVHQVMHVRDTNGQVATAVEAFLVIWRALPSYQWAARLVALWPVKGVALVGYHAFARIRPYLPKRKRGKMCSLSPHCDSHDPNNQK